MKKIFIALIGIFISIPSIFAANYYVSTNGNDANSGATWALAKKTIQAGVDLTSNGDAVWVTNGTYVLTNQISISKGITVQGVNGALSTIVNGNYPVTSNRCFSLSKTNTILDGFTIINGYADSGGGVNNYMGIVKNCMISGNTAFKSGAGGVCNHGGTIRNCTISGNSASWFGGGVMNYGGVMMFGFTGTVDNCTISDNSVYGDEANFYGNGGGVYNFGGVVKNCTITGNTASNPESCYGGGVYNDSGIVRNCAILGNSAVFGMGGGVYNAAGTIQNCTILGNTATILGGMYNKYYGTVQNCIMYYNWNFDFYGQSPSQGVQYSCSPGLSGNGNIQDDPWFYNPGTGYGANYTGGDLRIQSHSPCINAGYNMDWMTDATDIAGNPRIIGGIVDLGAYESPYSTPVPVIGPTIKANGAASTLTVNYPAFVSVCVEMSAGADAGINKDWWVVALANSSWYYLNSSTQWQQFDGNFSNCHPVNQGPLFNLCANNQILRTKEG